MKQNANIRSICGHIATTHGSSFLAVTTDYIYAVTHSVMNAFLTVSSPAVYWGL